MNSKLGNILSKIIIIILAVFTAYLLYLNFSYATATNALIYALFVIPAVFIIYMVSCKINISPLAFFITIFTLALAAKGALAFVSNTKPVSDFNTFYGSAVKLINGDKSFGHGFYFKSFAYQTGPVIYYALIMKIFGTGLLPLKLVNCIFMAGSNGLIYLIARKISNDYTARFAALLYLLYPAPYFLAPVLTNQHFAACMFLLAIFTLLEERINFALKGIASGLILSLGNAVRPLGIIIIAAVVIWAAIEAIRRKNFGTLGVVTITAIVYLIMNFTLSSMVKAEDINPEGLSNNYPLWKFVVGFNYETKGTFSYNDQNNIFYIQDFNKRNEVSKKVIEDRISISPGKMLNLLAIKQEVMWSSFDTLRWGFYDKVNKQLVPSQSVQKYEPSILRIEKMYYIMAFILMLIGLCLSVVRKKASPGVLMMSVILICYFGAHALIEIQVRYRYFALMLVFILAAKGSELLMPACRKYRKKYKLPD